jgi:trehalose 6-phosphate phosphatase
MATLWDRHFRSYVARLGTSAVSPESGAGKGEAGLGPLAALREDPVRAAILTDVDGTLAPIVPRPEEAAVPARASELLAALSGRYGLVGCISGRRVEEARRLVGVEGIAYAGNHGLELLLPGDAAPRFDPALDGHEEDAPAFVAGLAAGSLAAVGLRLEDKGPIQSLHWRGAEDEDVAEAHAREIGAEAEREGLATRPGRKVLELRPASGGGKDAAVQVLLESAGLGSRASGHDAPAGGLSAGGPDAPTGGLSAAAYAGDDRTDLDAFRRLRELEGDGELEAVVCVGVVSAEGPAEIGQEVDLTVEGPEGWVTLLAALAE